MQNEHYFREHPEINALITIFIWKVLDEWPDDILKFSGGFFDWAELKQIVESQMENEVKEEERNKHLSGLISGSK